MLSSEWAKCTDCHHEQYMIYEDDTCEWCGGKLRLLRKTNYGKRYRKNGI